MRFSLDYLNAVLPPSNPPLESVPVPVQRAFGASEPFGGSEGSSFPEDEGPNITQRSAFWTYAIFSEFGDGSVQPTTMPGPFCPAWWWWRWWWCWWQKWNQPKQRFKALFSVGAFDRDFEGAGFGLIIESPFLQRSQIIDELFFPRLNRSFPVAARPLVEDLHAVPSLINATSTCWARDNRAPTVWGFVTCRHAVTGIKDGAKVALGGGGPARLERKAPPTIDAAFVSTSAPRASLRPMNFVTFPTAGQSVDVLTSAGPQARSVVAVTETLGVINDPYHPIKVYFDQPCQPGDSGALVQSSSGNGMAIYCGSMSGATVHGRTGQTVGIGQHLQQAVTVLDVLAHG
jgi:hypothetical protein